MVHPVLPGAGQKEGPATPSRHDGSTLPFEANEAFERLLVPGSAGLSPALRVRSGCPRSQESDDPSPRSSRQRRVSLFNNGKTESDHVPPDQSHQQSMVLRPFDRRKLPGLDSGQRTPVSRGCQEAYGNHVASNDQGTSRFLLSVPTVCLYLPVSSLKARGFGRQDAARISNGPSRWRFAGAAALAGRFLTIGSNEMTGGDSDGPDRHG